MTMSLNSSQIIYKDQLSIDPKFIYFYMSEELRNQRFTECSQPLSKGKTINQVSVMADSPLIFRYRFQKFKDKSQAEIYKAALEGLLNYGKSKNCLEQATEIYNQFAKAIETNQKHLIGECAVKQFTKQSFLYRDVNRYLRNAEFKDVGSSDIITDVEEQAQNLLPFCYILNQFVKKEGYGEGFAGTVYRGANLSEEQIQQYVKQIGNIHQWNGFSSTTKNRRKAQKFGNALFVIKLGEEDAGYGYKYGLDIQKLSYYPKEEEVLLFAGKQIKITDVKYKYGRTIITIVCTDFGA